MFSLEEYILKRKMEDGINERDFEKRQENLRICVNYIFEYFTNYLETTPAENSTILHTEKIEKYRKSLRNYDSEIVEWLVSLYSSYGKFMHRYLANYIDDLYFLLYDTEAEFRALSYEIYPKVIKKFKFLNNQSEMIFLFIKDKHRVDSLFSAYDDFHICESVDAWIQDTYQKYGVNLYNFANDWIDEFSENPDTWPPQYKKKSKYYDEYINQATKPFYKRMCWDYDYMQKSNLFNLDSLYRNMAKKKFTKNRKQDFEILLMYSWLQRIEGDESYWNSYLLRVLAQ